MALIALTTFRVTRLVIGAIGLQYEFGLVWALLGALVLVLLRFTLPIRIGAVIALVSVWRWPWIAALIFAAPRLVLVVPGLWSAGMARLRHPRPIWHRVNTA
jgi:hypothetical protein